MDARVAVNYLRARARQAWRSIFVSTVAQCAAGERLVIVAVSDSGVRRADRQGALPVHLVRDDERGWLVARAGD